jgi:hypothetical protein
MISWWMVLACSPSERAPTASPQTVVSRPDDLGTPAAHASLDGRSVDACAGCHEAIVAEWRTSMHARAHHDRDPVYGAMRTLRMARQGDQVARKCATCHDPLDPEDPDSAAGRLGVACTACHALDDLGAATVADGRTVCLQCHAEATNPAGAPVCTTGSENAAMGGVSCASCHMPPADGHASHAFPGPHRAWYQDDPSMLARAVAVGIDRRGDELVVSVTNTSGHGFPSGFPGRVARVRLVGDGWTAAPDALLFRKVYVDETGQPTLPPFAARLQTDSRLTPGETRTVRVPVPDAVTDVHAELVFALLPEPAAKALGITDLPEAKPVVVPLAGR